MNTKIILFTIVTGIRRREVRKTMQKRHIIFAHAVAQSIVRLDVVFGRKRRAAGNGAERDVGYVILNATTVRKSGDVAAEQAETIDFIKRRNGNHHV